MYFDIEDTIVAIATAFGEGGIGIVRLSGERAESLLKLYFKAAADPREFVSHQLYYGYFHDRSDALVDEVMAVVMRKPRSYTRENVVEVHCHGGSVILRRIVDLFMEGGARLARAGEFTLRAFLNGRIDLSRAEAVIDVIRSRSDSARRIALRQMEGQLSRRIYAFREVVSDLLAEVEAELDFPEEDLEICDRQRLRAKADDLCEDIALVLETFEAGRVLRDGLSILIFGKPNVGKSSLMNAILGEARAIVSEVPGTTRDTLEESLVLRGFPLRLIDTAGVRESLDPVESEGVQRAHAKVKAADLVLLVVDGSRPLDDDDERALSACQGNRILLVINKADLGIISLPASFAALSSVSVSARDLMGMESLLNGISDFFTVSSSVGEPDQALLSDPRHRQALVLASKGLGRFSDCLKSESPLEFAALELREVLSALGEITGETATEDILEKIFSRFCIGK